ncbi:TROVE domain-containing protein [Nocardia niwae]|uniref:TROVE domain-containing protein n=1 Tax=Nocardia niwae TaxID=626084 RepID=UPI001FE0D7C4|nr:TROVE domain-containing protein [Nocardia niwae]
MLAVSNMVGESTHYESADERDARYRKLIRKMAVKDGDWTAQLLAWLRGPEANMRSASLVGAAEYVKARLDEGIEGGNRHVISSVLQRADEPGEMLAYWVSQHGRNVPKPVKRGVADAAVRLYAAKSLLKYDTASHGFRFGDVIDLTHPVAKSEWQSDLFRYALDRRHNRENSTALEWLPMVKANIAFKTYTPLYIDQLAESGELAAALEDAGMTWEQLGSFGPWTAKRWEAIIPSLGIMAALRNLRNFDEAGVSDEVAATIAARFMDPEQVAKSRQFPFRFYAAYKATGSLRWDHALETALRHSLSNVPALKGRTLILVDQSPSMFPGMYYSGSRSNSDIAYAEKAALFGTAVALRADNADLVGYGFNSYTVPFRPGDSVLKTMKKFREENGTDTMGVLQKHYANHDRVIIVTDEQTTFTDEYSRRRYGLPALRPMEQVIPARVPVFTWNIAGYKPAHGNGANWHTFGGLNDAGFRLIPLLERGRNGDWPWIEAQAA